MRNKSIIYTFLLAISSLAYPFVFLSVYLKSPLMFIVSALLITLLITISFSRKWFVLLVISLSAFLPLLSIIFLLSVSPFSTIAELDIFNGYLATEGIASSGRIENPLTLGSGYAEFPLFYIMCSIVSQVSGFSINAVIVALPYFMHIIAVVAVFLFAQRLYALYNPNWNPKQAGVLATIASIFFLLVTPEKYTFLSKTHYEVYAFIILSFLLFIIVAKLWSPTRKWDWSIIGLLLIFTMVFSHILVPFTSQVILLFLIIDLLIFEKKIAYLDNLKGYLTRILVLLAVSSSAWTVFNSVVFINYLKDAYSSIIQFEAFKIIGRNIGLSLELRLQGILLPLPVNILSGVIRILPILLLCLSWVQLFFKKKKQNNPLLLLASLMSILAYAFYLVPFTFEMFMVRDRLIVYSSLFASISVAPWLFKLYTFLNKRRIKFRNYLLFSLLFVGIISSLDASRSTYALSQIHYNPEWKVSAYSLNTVLFLDTHINGSEYLLFPGGGYHYSKLLQINHPQITRIFARTSSLYLGHILNVTKVENSRLVIVDRNSIESAPFFNDVMNNLVPKANLIYSMYENNVLMFSNHE